jgi:hypothetical protein
VPEGSSEDRGRVQSMGGVQCCIASWLGDEGLRMPELQTGLATAADKSIKTFKHIFKVSNVPRHVQRMQGPTDGEVPPHS